MTSRFDKPRDHQLDRLVDGELTSEEYREVLAQLELEPDGWKRCALAFLEAQAWCRDLRGRCDESAPIRCPVVPTVSPGRRSPGSWIVACGALAGCLAAAFGLGMWWSSGDLAPHDADRPVKLLPANRQDFAPAASALVQTPGSSATTPTQLTLLVDRGDGQTEQFEMPVFDAHDPVGQRLVQQPAIPWHVELAIRRAGHDVRTQRHWTPVTLWDGRQAVFPVDELEIVPVSEDSFH